MAVTTNNFEALTLDEQRRLWRAWNDHAEFALQSLDVETEEGLITPMTLSPGQVRLNAAIAKQEAAGKPVRLIYLKSRRIQATTGVAAQFFHRTAFRPGAHTVVFAHTDQATANVFATYRRFHDRYRPFAGQFFLPLSKPTGMRINYTYGGDPESSWIMAATAGSLGFGRGFRITNLHFSEFPYYPNAATLLSAAMAAVPKLAGTSVIIEGTAKTVGDKFHAMWQAAQDGRDSDWEGIFMGWSEHPTNRMPLMVPADRFQDSLTREEEHLAGRYNLDLLQLNWRRYTINNDLGGDTQAFQREHPICPEEAFTAASRNRFSIPHIQRFELIRDPLVGELESDDVGVEKRITFRPTDQGPLKIFKRPEKGRFYAIGADCAQGIDVSPTGNADPDYTVAQVMDRDTGEQVALLRARMMPGESGRYTAALGRLYNMAQICGERNPGGGGVAMLEAIMNTGYPSALLYHRSTQPDRDPQIRGDRLGWDTSGVSRPLLLGKLDEAIRQNAIHVHDPVTQMELLTFVIGASGKAQAQAGCHDDTVIALALCLIVIEQMPRPVRTAAVEFPRPSKYGLPAEQGRGRRVRL